MIKKVNFFLSFWLILFCCFNLYSEEKNLKNKDGNPISAESVSKENPKSKKPKPKRVEEIKAENLNSWQEEFNLEGRKAGKYNIMITAEDSGGNVYIEGPYNIFVDPKSDKPICGITSPYTNMRVAGNLNIVGTAVDDDGISKIELILDEGTDHEKQVVARGKEFWSYYLDTNELEEGPHTIKVIGYDINKEPVKSNPTVVTWQLDRKLPETEVQDKAMGLLVSGNVHFSGIVSDGNGIKELSYSVDGGKSFIPIKLGKSKEPGAKSFGISIDSRKFEDGPSVLWFRAKDLAGSVGLYSFLYFIDNTKPEVKIVSPAPDKILNGKITVAGYAKDKIGVTGINWTFGKESGVIELIPGNPYWAVNLDTTGSGDKSRTFTISAVDKANNLVTVSQNIKLDQSADRPVISIAEPMEGQVYTGNDYVYVRGLITDDEKVASVKIQLDNQEPIIQENNGVYCYKLLGPGELPDGNHKITIIGIDENGVESIPYVTNIVGKSRAPGINNIKVSGADFVDGIEIHPESGSVITIPVDSPFGLKNVHYSVVWENGAIEEDIPLENKSGYTISIPVTPESAKGVMKLSVSAVDIYDRVTEFNSFYYVTNTYTVKSSDPKLVFDDSRIGEGGVVTNSQEFPLSGYVIGGTGTRVELVPDTPFVKASLVGNEVKLEALKAEGTSREITVRVRLDNGRYVESQPLIFKSESKAPNLRLRGGLNSEIPVDGKTVENVTINGVAESVAGISSVSYRIIPIYVEIKKNLIGSVKRGPVPETYENIDFDKWGGFSLDIDTTALASGMYLVEIVAESKGGLKSAKTVTINTIPDIVEMEGVTFTPKAPVFVWIDGVDVYGVAVYQGKLDKNVASFVRNDMKEGANALNMSVTTPDGGVFTSNYVANKMPSLSAYFALVNDKEYLSGMPVVLEHGAKDGGTVSIYIDSSVPVNSVSYEISGESIPGGDVVSKGAGKIIKPTEENPNRWIAQIPLSNLPSRVTKINASVKAGGLVQNISGSIMIVRPKDGKLIDDDPVIYRLPGSGTHYDENNKSYILNKGSKYVYYANVEGPITAEVFASRNGLVAETNGNVVTVYATKDGYYNQASIKVVDKFGDAYWSKAVNFIADSSAPVINISTPVSLDWVKNYIKISGTASDPIGIRSVEYSLDKGANWHKFAIDAGGAGVPFSKNVDIRALEEGLVTIDIRATDYAGNVGYGYSGNYKDITAPKVEVVQPLEIDVVNGTNLIVFDVEDNVGLNKVEYVSPGNRVRADVPVNPLISSLVGTEKAPIDDAMSFVFRDAAGNSSVVESWKFSIDNESDLPVAEIHVPEENQVITRDFTISGIVYDDDGESSIYYRIDNGEYKRVATNEVYGQDNPNAEYKLNTSYSIRVPFETMTDNEHTISVYAVDVNGVRGLKASRTFRVSTEEPKGAVQSPSIDTAVRNIITISGVASDKNGIAKVQVSLDNGCSYNDAVGTNNWSYTVDTRAIPGGTQVVFLKVTDKYGIEGLYSSLINIDNNAPELNLELPLDDSTTSGTLFFSGYTFDNVSVKDLHVSIRSLDRSTRTLVRDMKIDSIIGEAIDISDLPDGFYNVEVTAKDDAENVTNVSRNIHLKKNRAPAVVDILYPLNGEHKQGVFTIYGQTETEGVIQSLKLYVDGKIVEESTVTGSDFYKFELGPEKIADGVHKYHIDAILDDGTKVSSRTQEVTYSSAGPWVTIDNFTYGDFAVDRPYIRGRAGYSISEDDLLLSKTKEATAEFKEAISNKRVSKIEISFDNGKTYKQISSSEKWMYRIENQDLPEGYHFMLVKATMRNGEVAINRTIIQIDNTKPSVKLRAPSVGGRYNQVLNVSGLSNDDVLLEDVTIALRKGDKSAYEVPSFIQGLYLDFRFWGSTLFSVGAGLTFFDDVVKVQASYGQFTQQQRDAISNILKVNLSGMRYGGHVVSLKILANIASLPFSYFFGHDWDWLYASFALGADFSWFSETNSGKPQILSAIIGQLEFPKVKLSKAKAFSSFAMYTEASLWFIPTDVSGTVDIKNLIPQVSIGFRTNIF